MERRTAPPPADGRPRQLGNGGFNKALMPAQVVSLFGTGYLRVWSYGISWFLAFVFFRWGRYIRAYSQN